MYACSPEWKADWISEADLGAILGQLAGKIQPGPYGKDSIGLSHGLHFTGGEPFMNFKLLCHALVYQLEYYRRFKALGIRDRVDFNTFLQMEGGADFAGWTEFFIMGRAPYHLKEKLSDQYPRYPAESLAQMPCYPAFLRDWHNHFDNYGNYIPGFCGGISLGDCRELDDLLNTGIDLEEFPVLKYLVNEDMQGLLGYALDLGYRPDPEGYYSNCHLCVDLRKHLNDVKEFRELKPAGFYANLMRKP
jgi:hypothetical protein